MSNSLCYLRCVRILACLILFGVLPNVALPGTLELPRPERFKAGDLNVTLIKSPVDDEIVIDAIIQHGDMHDAPWPAGTLALAVRVAEGGRDPDATVDLLSSLGASLSASAELTKNRLHLTTPRKNLAASLAILKGVLSEPQFNEERIELLKERWIASAEKALEDPSDLLGRLVEKHLLGANNPLTATAVNGSTIERLTALTAQDLHAIYARSVRIDNLRFIITGKLTKADLQPLLKQTFGSWVKPKEPLPAALDWRPVAQPLAPSLTLVNLPRGSEVRIFAAAVYDPAKLKGYNSGALEMLSMVIGPSEGSALKQRLLDVAEPLAESAHSQITENASQPALIVKVTTDTAHVVAALNTVYETLNELTRPLPRTGVDDMRNQLVPQLAAVSESTVQIADRYVDAVMRDMDEDFYRREALAFSTLIPDDIATAARRMGLPNAIVWVVAGEQSAIEEPLRTLDSKRFGNITVVEPPRDRSRPSGADRGHL